MMESTTLSVVHDDQYKTKRSRGGAGIEPSSCKKIPKTTGEGRDKEKTEGRNNKKEEEKEKPKEAETREANRQLLFDLAAEGSDAESKCDWKWLGVPPWEIQHVCTN